VKRLMNIPDPVAQVLERRELGRVIVGRPHDFQVDWDDREETLRDAVTVGRGDRRQ